MTFALVLAGGGVAGIAWELGVLQGIADVDSSLAARVLAADTVIGTSAGSTVAAQITSGTPLPSLYDLQLSSTSAEIEVEFDLIEFIGRYAAAMAPATSDSDRRRRVGAFALAADTVSEAARRTAIEARLPSTTWPARDVRIPAVDAVNGEVVVFTPESGVSLVDAVAASCAVPGVWPPVTIGDRRYVDGGVRSTANADLARGASAVLVITPTLADQPAPWGDLDTELALLAPARIHVVYADEPSIQAFGTNPLSPTTRTPAAQAGREIGRAAAPDIHKLLA